MAVTYKTEQQVATITLDQQKRLNALNIDDCEKLLEYLKEVQNDTSVRVLVLSSLGTAFCTGVDVSLLDDIGDGHRWPTIGHLIDEYFSPIILQICELRVPTLCWVNGIAAGAGASLALACDFRIGSETTEFRFLFSNLGLAPDSGCTFFLPRIVGYSKALEYTTFALPVSAQAAAENGLLNWVVEKDNGERFTLDKALELASKSRTASVANRKLLNMSSSSTLDQMLKQEAQLMSKLGKSADHNEALNAFLTKSRPKFID